jgi:hypothetical protein
MLKKTMCLFAFPLLLSALPASANSIFTSNQNYKYGVELMQFSSILGGNSVSVKKGQTYNESNDPIFHSNGPESTTPQHGYFSVPLIVIGLAGILLYFSRND